MVRIDHPSTHFWKNQKYYREAASRVPGSWLNVSCYSAFYGLGFDLLSPSLEAKILSPRTNC